MKNVKKHPDSPLNTRAFWASLFPVRTILKRAEKKVKSVEF